MKTQLMPLASAAALILGTGAAMAETSATAMTDLNLRAGPGPMYKIMDVIPADGQVEVNGCIESADWCEVVLDGQTGWSYAPYLRSEEDESTLTQAAENDSVAVVEFSDESDGAALVAGSMGAVIGALVAGPAGAVAGGILSSATADAVVQPEVKIYAAENPVEPVLLNGEVVVGAVVPEDVTVYEMPEHAEYAYLNVNGVTVILDSKTRQIVEIVR